MFWDLSLLSPLQRGVFSCCWLRVFRVPCCSCGSVQKRDVVWFVLRVRGRLQARAAGLVASSERPLLGLRRGHGGVAVSVSTISLSLIFGSASPDCVCVRPARSVIYPFDLIKSQVQAASTRKSMMSQFRWVLQRDGFSGLFAGVGPGL